MEQIKEFYSKHIDLEGSAVSGDEIRTRCPMHSDKTPSFSFNMSSGMFKCFSPKCKLAKGGGLANFLSIIEDIPYADAQAKVKSLGGGKKQTIKKRKNASAKAFPYTQEHVDQRIAGLMNHDDRIQALTDVTFWTKETMEKYEIGYDAQERRYWIPIKENGVLVNIRKYGPTLDPKFIQVTGHSVPRLFPIDNIHSREIIIMEGEKDCILANQHGFNTITVTSGAGTFKSEWKTLFANKDVVICYDIDEAGRIGSAKVAQMLLGVARNTRVVPLPITEPDNGDYTDYIAQGHTPQDFRTLIDAVDLVKPESPGPIDIPDEVYDVSLDRVSDDKMFYKRTRAHVRVIGKDSSPAIIPKTITVSCNQENGRNCFVCDLNGCAYNTATIEVDEARPELLQLIECTTKERTGIIRDIFRIPPCKRFTIKETDHQSITRCSVIPSIDDIKFDQVTFNQKYVERDLFVLAYPVEANMDYEIESIAMPDPKNQTLVHLGYALRPADSSIEEFKMTPQLKQRLEIFQCPSEKK